jgi:hypothetical protein
MLPSSCGLNFTGTYDAIVKLEAEDTRTLNETMGHKKG